MNRNLNSIPAKAGIRKTGFKLKSAFLLALATFFLPPAVHAEMEDYPMVQLRALDKTTARTETFEAKVGTIIQYGTLYIKIQSCRKAPPIEKPESASFLQIWEVPYGAEDSEWVFSGWMFASSPALSAMDHPVYDVWVLDCLRKEKPNEAAVQNQTDASPQNEEELAPAPSPSENTDEQQ